MQNKGAIKFFAIAFAIVCLFALSFTFFVNDVEKKAYRYATSDEVHNIAKELANGNEILEGYYFDSISKAREQHFLDSMANIDIFNILVRKYNYKECKQRELNLGLDLKGGMNVTLEISVVDILREMAGNTDDTVFNNAIKNALEKQKNTQSDFVTLFYESFKEIDPDAELAGIFATSELRDRINFNSTDDEVLSVIRDETESAIDRAYKILRTRIDKFGVAQPNIQLLKQSGRILVELPGIKDPSRVRKLLQSTAHLEFWETYENVEIYNFLVQADEKLISLKKGIPDQVDEDTTEVAEVEPAEEKEIEKDTTEIKNLLETLSTEIDSGSNKLLEQIGGDTTSITGDVAGDFEEYTKKHPLTAYLRPAFYQDENGQYQPRPGPVVGYAEFKDTARINIMLAEVKNVFPRELKLAWSFKPMDNNNDGKVNPDEIVFELIALKITSRDGSAALSGDVIINARKDVSPSGKVEVSMSMNGEGTKEWKRLTAKCAPQHRSIAICLDDYVYSYPTVNSEIPNGQSQITGSFTLEEAEDFANILKAGKLPAPAKIVQEAVVGPSMGQEAINAGLLSMLLAFILVLIYMVLFYNKAGFIADIALVTNIFFMFGVLASLQAVLTLPGIAGIVLTLGMAVDANVIIFERIKEEVRNGKGIRLAISDGYKNAYSAIIDGNVTTLLTAIVLFIFGSGPVQGFATTLIIGICSSLFSSIFISRLIFVWLLNKNKNIPFDNKITKNWLVNINFNFLGFRKKAYIISAIVILIGIVSLATKGLNPGVDFAGGRSYVVRFDQKVKTIDIRSALEKEFNEAPEVKTFGPDKQVKITTKYLINESNVDSIIETKLYKGLQPFFNTPVDYSTFKSGAEEKLIGILSSQMVGPTIADDIKQKAYFSLLFALIIIFIYIALRFRKWQYGLAGISALVHDSFIAISMYSIFYNILPFNLEVDQSFIAAILTIIGYSINDTVIIFDRIREFVGLYPKRSFHDNVNAALNSTLARTFNTSGTTLVVLLTIFIFGGEVIRGFAFALMIGVAVGTYSSLFNASPIAYDLISLKMKKQKVSIKDNRKKKK